MVCADLLSSPNSTTLFLETFAAYTTSGDLAASERGVGKILDNARQMTHRIHDFRSGCIPLEVWRTKVVGIGSFVVIVTVNRDLESHPRDAFRA
jgi:hypothetical protein